MTKLARFRDACSALVAARGSHLAARWLSPSSPEYRATSGDAYSEVKSAIASAALVAAAVLFASLVRAQAPSPAQAGAPATREADPGVFTTTVLDRAEVRASRLEVKPGGTRRVHQHDDVQFHLFIPVSGSIRLTRNGEAIDAVVGQVYFLDKGTPHTFA